MFLSTTRSSQLFPSAQNVRVNIARILARPAVSTPALLFLLAIPHAITLLYLIGPDLDDSWYTSRAWAVTHTGWAYGALDQGVFNTLDGNWTYFGLVGNYIVAASVFLFGPTLFAVRAVSFVFSLALLALVYLIASKLFSHRAGMLAMLAGGFTVPFINAAHIGRQDIMVVDFALGALALYLYQSNDRLSIGSFISGLLLGLAFDIHLPAILFPPMLAALLIFDYKWRILKIGRTWGMIAGLCCATVYYLVVHVLPYPQTYFAIAKMQQGSGILTLPLTKFDPALWWGSLSGLDGLMGTGTLILGALTLIMLLYNPSRNDIRFAIVFIALLLSAVALLPRKTYFYAILLAPLFWILTGVGVDKLINILRVNIQRKRIYVLGVALIAISFLVITVPGLRYMMQNNYPNYESAMQFIKEATPPGKVALGNGNYWFARPDQPYYAWQQLVYYRRYHPRSTLEEAFRALKPDYLIIDDLTSHFLIDDRYIADVDAYTNLAISKREMSAFLTTHTVLASESHNPTYGDIRIYKINW